MSEIVEVEYPYVYDLYYRVRNAKLENAKYRLEFIDWVKAGVAFNVRGVEEPSRKIAYFGGLYRLLCNDPKRNIGAVRTAILKFYTDIFLLYQDHLTAQLDLARQGGSRVSLTPKDIVILPSFLKTPVLKEMLKTVVVSLDSYKCRNIDDFKKHTATIYVDEDSTLFSAMSLLYDVSMCSKDSNLLEVT